MQMFLCQVSIADLGDWTHAFIAHCVELESASESEAETRAPEWKVYIEPTNFLHSGTTLSSSSSSSSADVGHDFNSHSSSSLPHASIYTHASSLHVPLVYIDGPYSAPTQDWRQFEYLLLIGVGVQRMELEMRSVNVLCFLFFGGAGGGVGRRGEEVLVGHHQPALSEEVTNRTSHAGSCM